MLHCPTSTWLDCCRVGGPHSVPLPLAILFLSSAFSSSGCVLTVPASATRYGRGEAKLGVGCQRNVTRPRGFFQPLFFIPGEVYSAGFHLPHSDVCKPGQHQVRAQGGHPSHHLLLYYTTSPVCCPCINIILSLWELFDKYF